MDGIFILFAVIICVAIVIYLSYMFSKYISKGTAKINSARYMTVIDRLFVGQDRFLLIVKIMDQYYLVSVTGQAIQILKEIDKDEIINTPAPAKTVDFKSFKESLQNILSGKSKKE